MRQDRRSPLRRPPPAQRISGARRLRLLPPARGKADRPGPAPQPSKARTRSGSRSEEHTSELQSLMRISYAVFCLKKKKDNIIIIYTIPHYVLPISKKQITDNANTYILQKSHNINNEK